MDAHSGVFTLKLDGFMQLLPVLRTLRETGDLSEDEVQAIFLQQLLGCYYDSYVAEGIDTVVGHIVYRLTDYLPLARRQGITIYPNGPDKWFTLEDWRTSWEADFDGAIPHLGPEQIVSLQKAIAA